MRIERLLAARVQELPLGNFWVASLVNVSKMLLLFQDVALEVDIVDAFDNLLAQVIVRALLLIAFEQRARLLLSLPR